VIGFDSADADFGRFAALRWTNPIAVGYYGNSTGQSSS